MCASAVPVPYSSFFSSAMMICSNYKPWVMLFSILQLVTTVTVLLIDNYSSFLSFSSVALMNHSCSPNVIVTYKGTVAEVRAVQEINPGDEVRKHLVQRCSSVKPDWWMKKADVLSVSFRPRCPQAFLSLCLRRSLTATSTCSIQQRTAGRGCWIPISLHASVLSALPSPR